LTGPALQGDYVVVGDLDGYVHWLQQSDGAMAARAKTGGTVKAQPIVADGVLLVQNVEGKLTAYRLAN
jgi:outer membrane protein assembly factor BamB